MNLNIFSWFKKKLKKVVIKTMTPTVFAEKMEFVYMYQGKKFFRYKNFMEMPYVRKSALDEAQRWADMGIKKEMALERYDKILKLASSNSWGEVMYLIGDLRVRAEMPVERLTMRQCAAILFVHEDEDIGDLVEIHSYDENWTQKKEKMMEVDSELESNLFQLYLESFRNITPDLLATFRNYLKTAESMSKDYQKLVDNILKRA
jgi:hypothetical protein